MALPLMVDNRLQTCIKHPKRNLSNKNNLDILQAQVVLLGLHHRLSRSRSHRELHSIPNLRLTIFSLRRSQQEHQQRQLPMLECRIRNEQQCCNNSRSPMDNRLPK